MSDKNIEVNGAVYTIEHALGGKDNVTLARKESNDEIDKKYVIKEYLYYNRKVFDFIKDNPSSNYPQIYDIQEVNEKLIVVEEFISAKTLSEYAKEHIIRAYDIKHIMLSLIKILEPLHEHNIIHRDLKPDNILVKESEDEIQLILIDFNASKVISDNSTADTIRMGTPHFAALEQVYGVSDTRTDICGLGNILSFLLDNISADADDENLLFDFKYEPYFAKNSEKKLNSDLHRIKDKCIEDNPHNRYQNLKELEEYINKVFARHKLYESFRGIVCGLSDLWLAHGVTIENRKYLNDINRSSLPAAMKAEIIEKNENDTFLQENYQLYNHSLLAIDSFVTEIGLEEDQKNYVYIFFAFSILSLFDNRIQTNADVDRCYRQFLIDNGYDSSESFEHLSLNAANIPSPHTVGRQFRNLPVLSVLSRYHLDEFRTIFLANLDDGATVYYYDFAAYRFEREEYGIPVFNDQACHEFYSEYNGIKTARKEAAALCSDISFLDRVWSVNERRLLEELSSKIAECDRKKETIIRLYSEYTERLASLNKNSLKKFLVAVLRDKQKNTVPSQILWPL